MPTKEELIWENRELTAKLALAEKWMRREVQSAIAMVWKQGIQKNTRKHFDNVFAEEGVEIITRRILDIFGWVLDHAPRYTLERLIDAEIYWETLQRYPHMDALPIILAYQKILDAWIEERLIAPWRASQVRSMRESTLQNPLEKDLSNILTKNYTLSIGRLYQILETIRGEKISGNLLEGLTSYWRREIPELLDMLISDRFFLLFSELMIREIFSKKRHEKKVTYSDAKKLRESIVSWDSVLLSIFSTS
jgi:hypothetical protein